jgi:hypothetical protein
MKISTRTALAGLALLAALACLAGPAGAQAGTGTVIAVVQGAGGPVAAARVSVESAADSSYARSGETDAAGAVSFAEVPLGEVSVKVYDADDQVVVSGVGILERAGETITLVLQLEPAG